MYYVINVSRNGLHFFATGPNSVVTDNDLRKVLPEIRRAFPESAGYAVAVSHEQTTGRYISDKQLDAILGASS